MAYPYRDVRYSFGGPITLAVKWLIVTCVAAWILQQLSALQGLVGAMVLFPPLVVSGQIWRLATYLFLHGGVWHLALNMLMLFMFGCQIERRWGFRKFLFFFMLTGIGGGVVVSLVAPPIGVVGASGAIFGLIVAWALLFPDQHAYLIPFPIAIPARVFALICVGIEMLSVWGESGDFWGSVAHLGGALTGYLYLRRPWLRVAPRRMPSVRGAYRRWQNRRIARKFRVIPGEGFLGRGRDRDDRDLLN